MVRSFSKNNYKNELFMTTATRTVVRGVLVGSSFFVLYSLLLQHAIKDDQLHRLLALQPASEDKKDDHLFGADTASNTVVRSPTKTSKTATYNPALELVQRVKQTNPRPRRFCPCCGWTGDVFVQRPVSGTNSTQAVVERGCPVCGALERHRKVCAMVSCPSTTPISRQFEDQPFRLLHFGPEKAMMKLFNQFEPSIDQVGVDMFASGYTDGSMYDAQKTLQADVADLKFPTHFANGIIILHVLEHVRPLEKAAQELWRVLAPGGWILMEVPCGVKPHQTTRDCRNYTLGKDLEQCAGQFDHVWWFTCDDFAAKMAAYGLQCEKRFNLDHEAQCLDEDLRHSILPSNVARKVPILYCRKPNAVGPSTTTTKIME